MRARSVLTVSAGVLLLLSIPACSSTQTAATAPPGSTSGGATGTTARATTGSTARSQPPGTVSSKDRATVKGTATVDGAPFDAQFIGASVTKDGLTTACQADIPPVTGGRYQLPVLALSEGNGCGEAGAEIVLWTYVKDQRLFSTTATPWPGNGGTAEFNAQFSTANPAGKHPAATELAGEVTDNEGYIVEPPAKVEALVGTTVCGVSTVRENGDFVGFSLGVVGPESKPGCERGAEIHFKVGGKPAKESLPNDGSLHRNFPLTLL